MGNSILAFVLFMLVVVAINSLFYFLTPKEDRLSLKEELFSGWRYPCDPF